jgi:predicted nucleotidyltransferase
MDSFNIKKAKFFLLEKEQKRKNALDKKYREAYKNFENIVDHIIKNYSPAKIYQWGSLLNKRNFSEISDIDIAIEGIVSVEKMFQIYGDIMDLSNFHVDIVQMEKIEPEFAQLIREKGKLIYERKN